jgi:uncharacterized protein (TIGR02145 family)
MRTTLIGFCLLNLLFLCSCSKKNDRFQNLISKEELAPKGGGGKGGGKKNLTNTLVDVDGNTYATVTIGKQVWMVENLRVTRYRDSTPIPNITDHDSWSSTVNGAWSYYENDSANNNIPNGKLYNWFVVDEPGKTLAPAGWHLPDSTEWNTLFNTLKGSNEAGPALKSLTGWEAFNLVTNTNSSGFTGYPAGYCRRNTLFGQPDFAGKGRQGIFWTATSFSSGSEGDAFCVGLNYDNNNASLYNTWKRFGFSIRCVKD